MRRMFRVPALCAGLVLGFSATMGSAAPDAAAEITLVRLTPAQYQRTIHDIFGPSIRIDDNVVDPGFRDQGLLALGTRKLTLSSAELEHYETLAQQIAGQVTDPRRRATLVHCKPKSDSAPDNGCATQFVTRVGLFLFRRPLSDNEIRAYVAVASAATETLHSFDAGIRAALAQMLIAPEFLFHVERSESDPSQPGKRRLDAYSRASRLSFFLWNTSPDGELLAAAQSGQLLSAQGLNQQVQRLLASPRIEDGLRAFFSDMLGFDGFLTLSIDSNLYPRFTKNVEDDAREQTLRTIADQLLNKNRDYRELFTTRETFLTPSLAAVYGVPLPRSQELGGAVPWVPYRFPDGDPHIGLLTHVSFLSLHSHAGTTSPTLRGKALRENFLCQKIPPPPPNVDFSIVRDTTNPNFKTVRQRLTAHRNNPICAGCHRQTDPPGLSLEVFDASGVHRTTENGAPIDTSGDFNGKPFDGIARFAEIIKDEPATTSCLINRAFSYGTARLPTAEERTWLTGVQSELRTAGVKWRELMRRIALNLDFYTIPAGETQTAAVQQ